MRCTGIESGMIRVKGSTRFFDMSFANRLLKMGRGTQRRIARVFLRAQASETTFRTHPRQLPRRGHATGPLQCYLAVLDDGALNPLTVGNLRERLDVGIRRGRRRSRSINHRSVKVPHCLAP